MIEIGTYSSIYVTLEIETTTRPLGCYHADLLLDSNDPDNPHVCIPINIKITPSVPLAAPNTLVSQTLETSVELTWSAATTNEDETVIEDLFEYVIERIILTKSTPIYQELVQVCSEKTTYIDTTIQPGTSYNYRIKAIDVSGYESTYTVSHELVAGDANTDGIVNVSDVVYLLSLIHI